MFSETGQRIICQCPKRRTEIRAAHGCGFGDPHVYIRALQDAQNGKYDSGIADFLKEHPDAAIDAEYSAYKCRKCGHIQNELKMDVYLKKEGVDTTGNKRRPWSVAVPACDADYVAPSDLKKRCKPARTYKHVCQKCGAKMKRFPESEAIQAIFQTELSCPKRSIRIDSFTASNWD